MRRSALATAWLALAPLAAQAQTASVTIEWNSNAESDLSGYRLFQSTRTLLGATTQQASADPLVTRRVVSPSGAATVSLTLSLAAGPTYYFRITAFDTSSNESAFNLDSVGQAVEVSTYIARVPDTTPPTVSLTAPAAGPVSGLVQVSGTASDNVGLVGVQFKLDGADLGVEDTAPPYDFPWDTTQTPNGAHTLTAVARDAAGLTSTSAPVSVTVSNLAPPPPGLLLLHSTLDSVSAMTSPAAGTGLNASVNTSPANDFATSSGRTGLRVDAAGEYGRFALTDGASQNTELSRGTADFWFQPSYPHTDGNRHSLLSFGTWGAAPGGLFIEKNNGSNGNALTVYVFNASGTLQQASINSASYSWAAGQWVEIRVTWDFTVATGVQSVRIYVNGVEGAYSQTATGPTGMGQESTTQAIYLGMRNPATTSAGEGIFDDLRIYSSPLATVSALSCSQADVQNAINAAQNGDVVQVPAGSCSWNSSVVIQNKGITLQGAGIDQTVIIDAVAAASALDITVGGATSLSRVTGLTFDENGIAKTSLAAAIKVSGAGLDRFRLDHIKITNVMSRGIIVHAGGQELSGVIDHCVVEAPFNATAQGISVFGAGAQDGAPFARPLELGSGKFIFVEDCTFNFTYDNDGALDAYGGARYVFRRNTVHGTTLGHHGADSGGYRGVHSFEIYDNSFDLSSCPTCSPIRKLFFRSGTGVVFNNSWSSGYGAAEMDNYRSCQSFAPWGLCDGSSPWDENRGGQDGYACLDQIGHVFTQNQGGTNLLEPLYFWNNTQGGSPTTIGVATGRCPQLYASHLIVNRDFYNNVLRPGYSPYAYPHPLISGVPPPPPPADAQAPAVSLIQPAAAALLASATTLIAVASDNVGVVGVQFKLDGAGLGPEDTSSPYSISWNTTAAPDGAHTLTAVARDATGNASASTAVNVTVDNTPPAISNVSATVLTQTEAYIYWTANEVADAQVEYGLTTAYGLMTSDAGLFLTGNTEPVTGLQPGTLYHFRVRARDAAGNLAVSGDFTFTTLPSPPSVPTSYNALADRNFYPEPPLPAVGGAGFAFQDPTFGTRLVRVTDVNTEPGVTSNLPRLFHTPASAEQNTWNADSTMFYVGDNGSNTLLYRFDPATLAVSRVPGATAAETSTWGGRSLLQATPPLAQGQWSFSDPDLLYSIAPSNHAFYSYRVSAAAATRLSGPSDCGLSITGQPGNIDTTKDDRVMIAPMNNGQDQWNILFIYDQTRGCRWLDTATGQVGGQWGPVGTLNWPDRFRMHNARVSKDGRYVRMTIGANISAPAGTSSEVWEIDTLNVSSMPSVGHMVLGFTELVGTGGTNATGGGMSWNIRPLSNLTTVAYLVQPPVQPANWAVDSHESWNNAQPGQLVPFCLTNYRNDSGPAQRFWENEVLCVRSDGVQSTVWRFAHHRSVYNGSFWNSPRGNISQDGRFYMFTSNWGDTVGAGRQDVFIVELAGFTAPPPDAQGPVASITAPAANALLSGSVSLQGTASDPSAMAGVRFKLDAGVDLGPVLTAPPYTFNWNSAGAGDGPHSLTMVAWDSLGNSSTSPAVNVTVDNTPPSLSGISSLNVSQTSADIAWATNEPADGQVEYGPTTAYVSQTTLSPTLVTNHQISLASLSAGSLYHYRVRSRDAAGNLALSGDFTFATPGAVDTSSPTVSITTPAPGSTLPGSFTITASAADNMGVTGVQFRIDGANTGPLDIAAPYSYTASGVATGAHSLTAVAFDAAGNQTVSAAVGVTVDASAPSVALPQPLAGALLAGTTTLLAAASDNVGVLGVQFKLDGANLGAEVAAAPYTLSWNTTGASSGAHALTAVARDAVGNFSTSTQVNVIVDNAAPAISAVTALNVGQTSATITWTTNEPADGQVEYGPTTSYGTLTPLSAALVTTRQIPLSGLGAGSTYHFRARSRDAAGNLALSGDFAFTTLQAPPAAPSSLSASALSPIQIALAWTDNAATETGFAIERGVSGGAFAAFATVPANTVYWNDGTASPSTSYSYRVRAFNAAGASAWSNVATATTPAPPDTTAPRITHIKVVNLSSYTATVAWLTDEPADSQAEYGPTDSYGSAAPLQDTNPRVTQHRVLLPGLQSNTRYHFKILSRDAAGNLATSRDAGFRTSATASLLGEDLVFDTPPAPHVAQVFGSSAGTLWDPALKATLAVASNGSAAGGAAVGVGDSAQGLQAAIPASLKLLHTSPMGPAVTVSPIGSSFDATLTLPIPSGGLSVSALAPSNASLAVFQIDPVTGEATPVPGATVNALNDAITIPITGGGIYAVGATAQGTGIVDRVFVFPNPVVRGQDPVVHVEAGVADKVDVRIYDLAGSLVGGFAVTDPPVLGANGNLAYEAAWHRPAGTASGVYAALVTVVKNGSQESVVKKFAVVK